MPTYAKASKAYGFCDKTGFRYPLKDLVYEYKDGVRTGFRVGKDVVDPDQPQNFLGRVKIFDPQTLPDPRPDRYTDSAVIKYPVLNTETLEPIGLPRQMLGQVGSVTVSTS